MKYFVAFAIVSAVGAAGISSEQRKVDIPTETIEFTTPLVITPTK